MHRSKPQDPQFAEDRAVVEAAGAPRGHLVASPEKVAYAFGDVVVHRPIRKQACSVAEVVGPALEKPVQVLGDVRPGTLIARPQNEPDLLLQQEQRAPDASWQRSCIR